ncbi:hypothetical protein ACIRTR_27460 [Pseudomonas aeruginosa]|uniref:hypothetical protein n=1 Tax=Pseudomonas aeruginosa TaxID=287 RepID=UPI003D9C5F76
MSGFQDQSIDEGVRKRTAYQNDRRARLALNVERQDGGILQIPVASDMLGHEEHERIQQNTFLAVMPLVRLPTLGKAGYGDQLPAGALPRAGRIYLFQDGKLCANWNVMARATCSKSISCRGAASVRTSVRP